MYVGLWMWVHLTVSAGRSWHISSGGTSDAGLWGLGTQAFPRGRTAESSSQPPRPSFLKHWFLVPEPLEGVLQQRHKSQNKWPCQITTSPNLHKQDDISLERP